MSNFLDYTRLSRFWNSVKSYISGRVFATGTWTPHLYDLNTKVMEIQNQRYYRIGDAYFCVINVNNFTPTADFSTMFQVRNLPIASAVVIGGQIYLGANFTGAGGDRTLQVANNNVYFRPNIKLTSGTNYGYLTMCVIAVPASA